MNKYKKIHSPFKIYYAFRTVTGITPEFLEATGVRALALDLDNTLTTHDNPIAEEAIHKWIALMKKSGIKMLIVSNNSRDRVRPFAEALNLPFIPKGAKPLSFGYDRAVRIFRLPKDKICAVGDQIFTDILGANLAGLKTIFVNPIEPEKTAFFKLKRKLEKPFLPKKYISG